MPISRAFNTSGSNVANAVTGDWKNDQSLSDKQFLLSCKEVPALNHTRIGSVNNAHSVTTWYEI